MTPEELRGELSALESAGDFSGKENHRSAINAELANHTLSSQASHTRQRRADQCRADND